jgi:fatty-acyl-CoA synthase
MAVILPNTPPMYEAHFGVPMCGAVLNALNTRLDAQAIAFMLEHGEAKLLITDTEFSAVIDKVKPSIPVIGVEDAEFEGGTRLGDMDYEGHCQVGDWCGRSG